MASTMTIEQYLRGKCDFNLADNTIAVILLDNGVATNALVESLSEEKKDLCIADLYMWLATSSVQSSAESESDGGWSRTKSAKNVQDRLWYKTQANALYSKWNSEKASLSVGITMKSLY